MYFNNVETRPGVGYPRQWEDQEKWKGGWTLDNSGKLALSTGSKTNRLMKLFFHLTLREVIGAKRHSAFFLHRFLPVFILVLYLRHDNARERL